MDLILKIKELNSNIDKIEKLADDLIDNLDGKRKKINHLKDDVITKKILQLLNYQYKDN